jgi:hypothetical protein
MIFFSQPDQLSGLVRYSLNKYLNQFLVFQLFFSVLKITPRPRPSNKMALSKFLLAFALVSTYLAHLSLAQVDGSTLLYGGTSGQPFQIPEASWADSIAQPNATYTIGISGPKLSEIDHNLTPGAWDISIAVAAEISTVGSSDTSVNQSLVFTGTQVSFAPAFNMTAPKGAEWEVCFAMGFPGITSDDIGAIGPINAGGFNEGYCNFLTLSCQNDLEAAITTALAETKSHSCLDAGPITVPDSCGNTIIWDVLSFLSKSTWAVRY